MALSSSWRRSVLLAVVVGGIACSTDTKIDLFPLAPRDPSPGGAAPGGSSSSASGEGDAGNGAGRSSGGDRGASGGEGGAGSSGAPSGCCDCGAARNGKQLRFRREKLGVGVAWPEDLRLGPERTIEAWIYPVSDAAHLVLNKFRGGEEDVMLRLLALRPDAYVYSTSGNVRLTSEPTIELGVWHHVALVQDAESTALFVDGAEVGRAASGPPGERAGDLRFGGGRAVGFDGYLADVRVSAGARYREPFTPPRELELTDATVGLWRFDEGAGDTVCDEGAWGLTGAIDSTLEWEVGPGRP